MQNTINTKFKISTAAFLTALNKIGKATVIIAAIAIGFISGDIYNNYKNHTKMSSMQNARKTAETSVAVNERGELMVIDRKTGTYTLYENGLGQAIFNIYANRIYQKK
jgi:hypothetical protein